MKIYTLVLFFTVLYVSCLAQTPTITSFTPLSAATGTTVTISGTNFTLVTSVKFGGTPAASFTIVNSKQIIAIVGNGSSGSVSATVISSGLTGSKAGFNYLALSGIVTDYSGFWATSTALPNPILPVTSHNLLAFTYNNITYSTGVNNSALAGNGVSYTSGSFKALPINEIGGNTGTGLSTLIALAQNIDGNPAAAVPSAVSTYTIKKAMTDGNNGLDLGTGVINFPTSGSLTLNLGSINTTKINDAEPDIIITQIYDPSASNDVFQFVDINGSNVGNSVTQDMIAVSTLGNQSLDIFNQQKNTSYTTATVFHASQTAKAKPIRIVAFKLSDFGITTGNASMVKGIKVTSSGNSDYAFIGYNTTAFSFAPNISQNIPASIFKICEGNTASLVVTGQATTGGTLTYGWETSTDGGTTWSPVTNGGNVSGAFTNNLQIAAPLNNTQYRATVTESTTGLNSTSIAFILTVNPTTVSGNITGGGTLCSGTNSATLTLNNNVGKILQWQSSRNNFVTLRNITDTTNTLTVSDLTSTMQYRAIVQSGLCPSAYSDTSAVTIISSVGGSIRGSTKECLGMNSKTLTLTKSVGTILNWQSSIDSFASNITNMANTTASLVVNNLPVTTQYRAVVQNSVCPTALSSIGEIKVVPTGGWIGSSSGDWNKASNWCGGIPTATSDVIVPANTIINIQSANVTVHSVTIIGSVVMQGAYNLNITSGGSFNNTGTFNDNASTGAVSFLGNGTISGTTAFKNIQTSGALDFGTSSTIAGNFTIQPGGSVTGNGPFYTCPAANLIYNTGGTFDRGIEWSQASSGKGYPANVIILNNSVINFPAGGDGHICNDLTIAAGASLYQDYSAGSAALSVGRNITINGTLSLGSNDGGDISIGGNWKRNAGGVFNNNQRTVIFNGAGNSLITAPVSAGRDANGAFGGETFYKVMVTKTVNSATVSLGSPMSVIYELALTKGTFDLQNSDVTMVSNISGSAHLAPLPTSGGVVTNVALHYGGVSETGSGRFVIQHYFNLSEDPASRRWHFLTVPFDPSDAPTISTAWQEGVSNSSRAIPVDPWPGFGTTITKTKAYDPASGYDQGLTNNPSLYYYTGTDWGILPTTNTQPITDYQAYMLFIRGSRNIVISSPRVDANPTTLEPRGKLSLGDVGKPLAAGFQPMGNPYAADIDFNKAAFNNYTAGGMTYNTTPGSPEGLGITYYIWDPLTDGSAGVGKFIACSSNGDGTYTVTSNTGGIPEDGTIPAGAAFMLAADNGGASLTFHEADKLNTSFGAVSRPAAPSQLNSTFSSNLYAGSGAAADLADGVVNIYADYSNNVDGQDALSLSTFNTHEWLSIARDGTSLSIERRNWIKANDTIFLALKNLKKTAYELHFKASNFDPSITAMLEDTYTGKSTSLNVTDGTNVSFTINSDSASSAVDRFRVVFRPSATLPITFRTVKAYQQNNSIAIQWTVENQLNITKYQVEKSTNGTSFSTIVTVSANGDQQSVITYNSLDANAAEGNNFYRIKYFNGNGTFAYSRIVKVVFGNGNSNISVYPNPVTDGNITLQLNNIPAGVYNIRIIDNLGKIVSKTVLTHSGGNATQTFYQKNLISGTYMLEMSGADNKTKSVKLIVETK